MKVKPGDGLDNALPIMLLITGSKFSPERGLLGLIGDGLIEGWILDSGLRSQAIER